MSARARPEAVHVTTFKRFRPWPYYHKLENQIKAVKEKLFTAFFSSADTDTWSKETYVKNKAKWSVRGKKQKRKKESDFSTLPAYTLVYREKIWQTKPLWFPQDHWGTWQTGRNIARTGHPCQLAGVVIQHRLSIKNLYITFSIIISAGQNWYPTVKTKKMSLIILN